LTGQLITFMYEILVLNIW